MLFTSYTTISLTSCRRIRRNRLFKKRELNSLTGQTESADEEEKSETVNAEPRSKDSEAWSEDLNFISDQPVDTQGSHPSNQVQGQSARLNLEGSFLLEDNKV